MAGQGPRTAKRALVVVDVQEDFVSGSLAVPGAAGCIPLINELMRDAAQDKRHFDLCIATKDYHPEDHVSFAPSHPGAQLGDVLHTPSRKNLVKLFPPHCVAGTPGAEFAEGLEVRHVHRTFHKGVDAGREAYSGFYDMGHKHSTGLADFLRSEGVGAVVIVGVALDYCVRATALDALGEGFETLLIVDAVAAVDEEEGQHALEELESKGVKLIRLEGGTQQAVEGACERLNLQPAGMVA